MTAPDTNGWMPINDEAKAAHVYVWLSNGRSMRLGFWQAGKQHENQGSIGGGWCDLCGSEQLNSRTDLHFLPTHWQPLPKPPVVQP